MKSKLLFGVSGLIIGAVIVLCLRGCSPAAPAGKEVQTVERLQNVPINHWIDVNGLDHATKEEASVSSQAAIAGMKGQLEYQAKLLKIKPQQLKGYSQTAFVDTGRISAYFDSINLGKPKYITLPGGNVDTVERYFEYLDRWAWMEGAVGKKLVQIDYQIQDTLTHREYVKRKWLLGKERLYMDASLSNPNAYITGMTGIRIADKMPGRFSVGPYIGFDFTHLTLGFGISVQYAVFRF